MATTEYNQEQSGLRSELDEPRRTTETEVQNKPDFADSSAFGGDQQQEKSSYFPTSEGGGYGGVSKDEPPHHKVHTDDELLPKPKSGTYDDMQDDSNPLTSEEPREEQVMPQPSGDVEGAPKSTEGYQDYRSASQPEAPVDETPESEPRSFGEGKTSGSDYSDPSSAFPGAPVDRKVEEPGYGYDDKSSEPTPMETAPESPTPKKEGFVQKLKEKLPGHHKTATPETVGDESPTETGTPKKGLMTKIKEKLPGHHTTTPTTTE